MTHPHPYLPFVRKGSQLELDLLFEDSESLKNLLGPDEDFLKIEKEEYKKRLLRNQFTSSSVNRSPSRRT